MVRALNLLAALAFADAAHAQVSEACAPSPGYRADVEVIVDGVPRHGHLIVTGDGAFHLERLDDEAARHANAVLRRALTPLKGWDGRVDPVRCVWSRLGPHAAVAEVHAPTVSLVVTRHEPLVAR